MLTRSRPRTKRLRRRNFKGAAENDRLQSESEFASVGAQFETCRRIVIGEVEAQRQSLGALPTTLFGTVT